MDYIIKGSLTAMMWDECRESLPNVKVKLYDSKERQNLNDLLAAGEKYILVVDTDEVKQRKKKFLLGESQTDCKGNFTINISEKLYQEQAFEIAICCESMPGGVKADADPIEFVVATILPSWQTVKKAREFEWNYVMPFGFWRYILSLFDVWVIYGRVVSPGNPNIPIVGVEVLAKDADWLSENELGSSVTDRLGYFRIHYSSKDFIKSSVSPDTNGKPVYPSVYGGPDVCFSVKSANGVMLIDETKLDGRKPERSNIGNCFCITLPIAIRQKTGMNGMDSMWTGIGSTFSIPDGKDLNDFDASGYTGVMKYAISGNIRLTGRKVNKVGPHPIEYRFLISKNAGVNGAPALPASQFSLVVGKNPGLFVETRIGQMWRFAPTFRIVNIYAKQIDLDAEGWLDINRSIERTFKMDPTLDMEELSRPNLWTWVDHDGMMAINTDALTLANNVFFPEIKAGDDILPSDRIPIEKISIRVEIREVIDRLNGIYNHLPGYGKTLNALVVNNNSSVKLLGLKDQLTDGLATSLSGQVSVVYTAYHPHLRDVSINIRKKSEIDWHGLSDVTVPLTCNNNPAITICHSKRGITIPSSLLTSSGTYVVMMYITKRLHNGDEPISTEWIDISFAYHKQTISEEQERKIMQSVVVS